MTTETMRAVVVKPDAPGKLALDEVPVPRPAPGQARITVEAFSLNRGEVRRAQGQSGGQRIGWDVAGVVETAAADGSGPPVGTRVAAFLPACDGWAERALVPTRHLGVIPEGVSTEAAAALPVAGLTALFGLERGRRTLGERVLITGANGGVGLFACQLAAAMGAHVVAQIRSEAHRAAVEKAGADEVVVDEHGEAVTAAGPYHVIFDGLGGSILAAAARTMKAGATTVVYGVTAAPTSELALGPMLGSGDAIVQGFNLYHEATVTPPGAGLERLMRLVAAGKLDPFVEHRDDWTKTGEAVEALLGRRFHGKAVLTLA